jgi:hypothetical protein
MSGQRFDVTQFLDLLATQAVVAYACLLLLWGTGRLARQAAALREELAAGGGIHHAERLFHRIESVSAPLALLSVPALVLTINGWVRYGPAPPLFALPLLIAYLVPIITFVWVYLVILADVDRLGGQPLALDRFPQDRTLGLEGVGSLAATGFVLVLAAAVPVMLIGSDEPATLIVALSILAVTVGLFLLSMLRLHRQMAAAKARYVAAARRLYEAAYDPVRRAPTVESLESSANALSVAQALDERAHSVMTWPIDESTLRFIAVVTTGVLTSLIVRALFEALGA